MNSYSDFVPSGSVRVSDLELESQNEYSRKVATVLDARYPGGKPLAFVHTYGCQGNVADGERIKGILESVGYGLTDEREKADLIIFNTCAIREHAEDRVFGNVGKLKQLKHDNPSLLIALCGCMMQQQRVSDRIKKSFPYVDIVFGTHVLHRLPELLCTALCSGSRVFLTPDSDGCIAEGLPVHRDSAFKAWLPIAYGCNNFCTYCIVPYVRGRERSRSFDSVLNEARQLVASGYREITLLGQNVNSFNRNGGEGERFPDLLRALNALEGDFTVRFMTSHPKDCTDELLSAMAECDKVAKHLHLPFQSGSNRVLSAMNRGYTREKYLSLIDRAYALMPSLSITSDIIVGFPGESEEEFLETLDVVERVRFTSLFTFIFSPRPGTVAAKLDDPVTREEKNRRFALLTETQQGIAAQRTAEMLGKVYRVLVEGESDKAGMLCGRTSGNVVIDFPGDVQLVGTFCEVRVTNAKTWLLTGEKV